MGKADAFLHANVPFIFEIWGRETDGPQGRCPGQLIIPSLPPAESKGFLHPETTVEAIFSQTRSLFCSV